MSLEDLKLIRDFIEFEQENEGKGNFTISEKDVPELTNIIKKYSDKKELEQLFLKIIPLTHSENHRIKSIKQIVERNSVTNLFNHIAKLSRYTGDTIKLYYEYLQKSEAYKPEGKTLLFPKSETAFEDYIKFLKTIELRILKQVVLLLQKEFPEYTNLNVKDLINIIAELV